MLWTECALLSPDRLRLQLQGSEQEYLLKTLQLFAFGIYADYKGAALASSQQLPARAVILSVCRTQSILQLTACRRISAVAGVCR